MREQWIVYATDPAGERELHTSQHQGPRISLILDMLAEGVSYEKSVIIVHEPEGLFVIGLSSEQL